MLNATETFMADPMKSTLAKWGGGFETQFVVEQATMTAACYNLSGDSDQRSAVYFEGIKLGKVAISGCYLHII